MICPGCKRSLPAEGDGALCGTCKKQYHFECTTVSESSWRTMSTQKKADWKCTSCRKPAAETRSGSGSRLVRTSSLSDEASSDTEKENSLMKKLEILWTKEFKDFEHRFTKKMNDRFEDFEKSLEFTSQRVDDMAVTMKNIEQKMILIEKKQEKNENEFKELKTKVKSLETELKELVQAGCNNKLELSGLPKVDNMNEKDVAKLFVEKVGINPEAIGHYEVEKSVKNNDSQRASTSLLISFRTPEIRNSVYGKIKKDKIYLKVKDIVRNSTNESSIYVNEYLSAYYRKLFYEAKKVKVEKNYAFLWVREGKILLKKTQDARIMRLSCMEDLGKL
ncbi:hypothetical protein M8J77_015513 [Diaphorina citri]|nr:hypothetical protein M8J77_020960 [Diaphorina citri]KAI5735799.1 hypothetical protein M8J77_022716 [Diaphorina citri]KAI5752282.1 hypothetical protein M8J77_015513 [Diaphorina citri]